jgi:hypothetical protein
MRATSIHPFPRLLRMPICATSVGLLALLLTPLAARGQVSRPDLKLAPAELEIHQIRATSELGSYTVDLQVLAGVRNNGSGPGAFDYALGSRDLRYVYFTAPGTTLASGGVHAGAIRVPYKDVLAASGGGTPSSLVEVCYGLFLIKAGSRDGWADSNNPNHRKSVCTKVRIPAS